MLSASRCLVSCARLAPSATRTDASRERADARDSRSDATFAHRDHEHGRRDARSRVLMRARPLAISGVISFAGETIDRPRMNPSTAALPPTPSPIVSTSAICRERRAREASDRVSKVVPDAHAACRCIKACASSHVSSASLDSNDKAESSSRSASCTVMGRATPEADSIWLKSLLDSGIRMGLLKPRL